MLPGDRGYVHIALIGSTSAGKSTLARGVIEACRERGLEAWLSEDYAAGLLGFEWIRSGFVRRRILEVASFFYCAASWNRYRDYHALVFRLIGRAPGSWLYKAGLARLMLRKTGIHEILRRHVQDGQVVISDNEAVLQGAHHLFVHPENDEGDGLEGVEAFTGLAPTPDYVFYMRTPAEVTVERVLRRGHLRLGAAHAETVAGVVRAAIDVFDRVCAASKMNGRLVVIDGMRLSGAGNGHPGPDEPVALARNLVAEGLRTVVPKPPEKARVEGGFALAPPLARRLVGELNDGVPYCHWKSNYALARGADGDLDILIDAQDLARTRSILVGLSFREAVVTPGPVTPGVWHYYGLDESTGTLVHVHLFSRVITGESYVKSHRLPLDGMLLEHTENLGSVRIPRKAAELVVFVLRNFVKYGSLPDLLRLVRGREALREELEWLLEGSSLPEALALVETHCPTVDQRLFLQCLRCLHRDESVLRRIVLALRLRRRLRTYAVRSTPGRLAAYGRFSWAYIVRKIRHGGGKKVWSSGGSLIAFVGPDATGKSTLSREAARWLRSATRVETVHLGKPRSSVWTLPFNLALRAMRAVRGRRSRKAPTCVSGAADQGRATTRAPGWSDVLYGLRAVALAVDRRRAVRKAWLSATRGGIVICDRYPTAQPGAMDGPRLAGGLRFGGLRARIYDWLARIEERLYRDLRQPDVLIRLTVSLETAKERNRVREKEDKHSNRELERRHQALGSWSVPEEHCWDVSTEGPIEGTLSNVKQVIWQAI